MNDACGSKFSEKDLARRRTYTEKAEMAGNSETNTKTGRAFYGNQYFDSKSRKWKPIKLRISKKIFIKQKLLKPSLVFSIAGLMIIFGFFRIATNWLGWFSIPWIERWATFTLSFISNESIPWEFIFMIIGVFILYRGLQRYSSYKKGFIAFGSTIGVLCLCLWLIFPSVIDVLFWRGLDGEKFESYVNDRTELYGLSIITVGADGNYL